MGTVIVHRGESARIDMSGWRRRLREYWLTLRLLMKSPPAAVGLVIVLGYLAIVIYDQFFVPNNDIMLPNFSDPFPKAPFWWPGGTAAGGWFGTTFPGIDLGDAVLKAIRIDLMYSTFVVLSGAAIGSLIGVFAGFRGGLFDEALMRITDVTYSIPFLVFAIAVAFALSKRDFFTINLAPVFVQISLDLGVVTQIFAALEFIGFNAGNLFLPELGNLINIGWTSGFRSYPWTILMPGIALLVFTVAVNLLGDGLRDVLDPRARR